MTNPPDDIFRFSAKPGERFSLAAGRMRHIPDRYWPWVPVATSEVFHLCGEAPVLFRRDMDRWRLVVPASLPCRRPVVTGAREWLPPYVPFVLRILPFVREDGGTWSVDRDVCRALGEAGPVFLGPDGTFGEGVRAIVGKLGEFETAAAAASDAVARLETQGLLAPVHGARPGSPENQSILFAVDASRLARCRQKDIGALAEGNPSSIELALCSAHSMRFLADSPSRPVVDALRHGAVTPPLRQQGPTSDRPTGGLSGYVLDGSDAVDTAWLQACLETLRSG